VTVSCLPESIVQAFEENAEGGSDFSLKRARRAFEAGMIRRALQATDGNRTHAAKLLEISHRALLYKIKEYRIRD
jgi:two-component system response regulator AtoC